MGGPIGGAGGGEVAGQGAEGEEGFRVFCEGRGKGGAIMDDCQLHSFAAHSYFFHVYFYPQAGNGRTGLSLLLQSSKPSQLSYEIVV